MNRKMIFIIICYLLTVPGLASASTSKIKLEMEYKITGGRTVVKSFGTVNTSTLNQRGLWVIFRKEKENGFPGIAFGGNLIFANDPIERMDSLELVVTVINGRRKITKTSVLFSKTRPMGTKTATHENIYHLLVLDGFTSKKSLPESLGKKVTPHTPWKEAFFRTHRLAMNYAVQSDERTRKYENAFGVKATYHLPRLILIAEEWLDIPEEVPATAKKKSSGLFGGKMNEINSDIAGKKKIKTKKIPIYSIDILLDRIEADGKYPVGFQSTRSVRNDILEGEIIYHATGSKRRVITSTTVFSQMQKNIISKNSGNRIVSVRKDAIAMLNQCEHLWPSAKKDIIDFLQKNPEWNVVIPEKPVVFYSENKPVYSLYAWYQVHPETGRMVGVLPNSTRGAFSDELAHLEKGLLSKSKNNTPIKTEGSSVKALFSQVAGMYIASAGVLDVVALTLCDPTLANLNEKEWIQFLTHHSLYFCQKFLENNADLYDSYASQIGFWQGALFITYELGGTQAAKECANNAYKSITDSAIDDAKKYIKSQFTKTKKALSDTARKTLDNELDQRAAKLKKLLESMDAVKASHDKGTISGKNAAESMRRYNAEIDDLKTQLIKKGLL